MSQVYAAWPSRPRPHREDHRSAFGARADSGYVHKAEVTPHRLRRVLQAARGESRVVENATFDLAGYRFRFSVWRLGRATVVEVVRPEAIECHVRSRCVVQAFELSAQGGKVVKSLDDRHALQPLVLERLDDSLGGRNGVALLHGSEAGV